MNQMTPNPAEFPIDRVDNKVQPTYIVKAVQLQIQNINSSLPNKLQSQSQSKFIPEVETKPNLVGSALLFIYYRNH